MRRTLVSRTITHQHHGPGHKRPIANWLFERSEAEDAIFTG